jgi:hypothetical protein
LNNFAQEYCETRASNMVEMDQDHQRKPHNATRKFQKNVGQVWKITNFDRQPALFNGASMEAIT